MSEINVVVTCTKRKTRAVSSSLRFRAVKGRKFADRAEDWIGRLTTIEAPRLPARDLYAGDQWQIAKSLPGESSTGAVQLWVSSAGYGLVSADSPIKSYSATFSAKHPDSVHLRSNAERSSCLQEWWERLSRWKGPSRGAPRTLEALATRFPSAPLLVIASNVYLSAMENDLLKAACALRTPELLTIVSGGTDESGALSDFLVPCDARFQGMLGGALMSLNVRLARKILNESDRWPILRTVLQVRYRRLLERQPAIVSYDRQSMNDDEIKDLIREWLQCEPGMKHSPLLRRLRDSGLACEQKRFRALFREIEENSRDR